MPSPDSTFYRSKGLFLDGRVCLINTPIFFSTTANLNSPIIYESNPNTQCRYLTTTNTWQRYPFFANEILCQILGSCIEEVLPNKDCLLIGYKINPEHTHLIVKTGTNFSISQVMQAIKRISSLRINQMSHLHAANNPYENLSWTDHLKDLCDQFYGNKMQPRLPPFKWQK
ncbi:MAG: transposase, partial [Saprospiraceae bacterium]|nr:transposase [Saprospiraceae bacterium]